MSQPMTKEAFEKLSYDDQNRVLIQQLLDADNGECKQAEAASGNMIRRRIRENGFMRKILPPKQISDSDLNRLLDTENPAIIEPGKVSGQRKFSPSLTATLATWTIPAGWPILFR